MGRPFESILDWSGIYVGRFDGRKARFEIGQVYEIYPPDGYAFGAISYTDLDQNKTYSRETPTQLIANVGPQGHELPGFTLLLNGNYNLDTVTFSRLLIHTQDIDYISGESVWNGQEYGAFFTRQ